VDIYGILLMEVKINNCVKQFSVEDWVRKLLIASENKCTFAMSWGKAQNTTQELTTALFKIGQTGVTGRCQQQCAKIWAKRSQYLQYITTEWPTAFLAVFTQLAEETAAGRLKKKVKIYSLRLRCYLLSWWHFQAFPPSPSEHP
jgi:hypothetical protein